MGPLESLMRAWLESGTPALKFHAAARLRLPFPAETHAAPPPAPGPGPAEAPRAAAAPRAPLRKITPSMRARVNTCYARTCAVGCRASHCHWRRRDVNLWECAECLAPAKP